MDDRCSRALIRLQPLVGPRPSRPRVDHASSSAPSGVLDSLPMRSGEKRRELGTQRAQPLPRPYFTPTPKAIPSPLPLPNPNPGRTLSPIPIPGPSPSTNPKLWP